LSDRRTALIVSCTAHVVQDGLTAATYVLLPLLAQAFGFTYAQVGLFKGVKSLTQGILELGSGILSERIGAGRTLVFGLICAGIGYSLLATASEAAIAVLCLLIVGVGSAFQHAPASAIITATFASGGRRGALGLYNSSGDAGKLAFSGAFSLAIGAGLAWQQIALSYGLIALMAAAGVAAAMWALHRGLPGRRILDRRRAQAEDAAGWGILHRQSYCLLLVTVFLDNVVQAGTLVFVSFLMLSKGFPLYLGTVAPVLVLAGGIFGKAGCGYLAERAGVRRAFALAQIVTALGLAGIVLAPGWLAFALLPPLGVFAQGSTSITYGIVADVVHTSRAARGFALMYGSTSFASALGPYAFGLLGDQFGIGSAMMAMAIIALLAIVPLFLLSATKAAAT
jgi:MFS family permease